MIKLYFRFALVLGKRPKQVVTIATICAIKYKNSEEEIIRDQIGFDYYAVLAFYEKKLRRKHTFP